MSVFKVKLNNASQGQMDLNPSTATPISGGDTSDLGSQFSTSIQRTIFVAGPNRITRKLKDGDTFTDCNYWKRFAYPQMALSQAFIEVVTDDGSVYSDNVEENTFPIVYDLSVDAGTDFQDNVVDFLTDTGSVAVFTQIHNQSSETVRVRINGATNAVFDLTNGETQIFNNGDLTISKLEFLNTVSGGSPADIQILASIRSVCNS
jgi:hypothetical protein